MIEKGVLLINLGTPDSAEVSDVKRYLREFLTDKRVISLPAPLRYLLVYGLILPFRAKKSAHAYQSIWTNEGSPLRHISEQFSSLLQTQLGPSFKVALGMRYGKPSISEALAKLKHCSSIVVLPLYPQYSSAATGSSLEEVMRLVKSWDVIPSLNVIANFYQHPTYIQAQAQLIKAHYNTEDHLLFSYHGLPEQQIIQSGCESVCVNACPLDPLKNPGCYKAQCEKTSFLLAKTLNLEPSQYSTSFQSRLGKTPWIKPYTDKWLITLREKGVKNLAIACPSFVTDCLETLEEIGMQARCDWQTLGGERFTLIPCLNTDALWVKAVVQLLQS